MKKINLLFILLLSICCVKVYAYDWNYTANSSLYLSSGLTGFQRANLYKCSSSSTCATKLSLETNLTGIFWTYGETPQLGTNGVLFETVPNISFYSNRLYSGTVEYCYRTSSASSPAIYTWTGSPGSLQKNDQLSRGYWTMTNDRLIPNQNNDNLVFKNCYRSNFVFKAHTGIALGFQLINGSNLQQDIAFIGYNVEYLGDTTGLTDSQVRDIVDSSISSSGLSGKMDSVNKDIQNSIGNLQEEQKQQHQEEMNRLDDLNKKQEETNDYLMDDTEPSADISGLGNVSGLLPPGPLDSLLNIPFKFLSVLTSSLGDVCVPLSGEFIEGATLTLPCFGDVFYSEVPDNLMIFINLIPSCFILINYFKHLYKKVERATSMNSSTDDEWGVI